MIVYAIPIIATISLILLILLLIFGTKGEPPAEDAKGFAKLLATEIKLYNDYKLQRGLANNNLYSSLRDEIREAENVYRQRFAEPEYLKYFNDALVNVLAEGDRNKLGREFNQMLK